MPVLITSISKENTLKLIQAFVLGNILHALLIFLSSYGLINLPSNLKLYDPYSVYSPFFVFSAFYCFYYFQHYIKNKNRIRGLVYLSSLLLFTYLIVTNSGRSGQLAFIFSILTTLALLHHNWKKTSLFIIVISIMIVTVGMSSKNLKSTYTTATNNIIEVTKGNYQGSWGVRWGLIVANTKTIIKNPILGVGIGDTEDSMQRVIDRENKPTFYSLAYFDHSHNFYISTLTSAGIIAFLMYILIHVYLSKLPITMSIEKHLSYIFLTILIVTGLADNILFYKPYNIYFAIMISAFINLSLNKKGENNSPALE